MTDTDTGLASLRDLPRLKTLVFTGSKAITDAALERLAKCPTLEELQIQECKQLTESGVRKLQSALPNCKITSDFPAP